MRFRTAAMVAVLGHLSSKGIAGWFGVLTWSAGMLNWLPFLTTTFSDQHEHFRAENAFDECVDRCSLRIELCDLCEESDPQFLLKIRLFLAFESWTAGQSAGFAANGGTCVFGEKRLWCKGRLHS